MKKRVCSGFMIGMLSLCSMFLFASSESHASGGWPVTPYKAVCADEERGLIFYASGDTVLILDREDLTKKSKIRIASNHGSYGFEGVQSMCYYVRGEERALYLALAYQGLRVYDVNDPANPVQKGPDYYNEPAIVADISGTKVRASDVAVDDDRIYIADTFWGIRILKHDLTVDESNLGFKSNSIARITLTPEYAYVIKQSQGFAVIEKSPEPPFLVKGLRFYSVPSEYAGISGASDFQINGNYAYVSDVSGDKIHFLDITDKEKDEAFEVTDTFSSAEYSPSVSGLCVSGERLYMADAEKGMSAIDIKNPAKAGAVIGFIEARGAHSVYADSNQISYLADCTYGLRRIDADFKETHHVPRPAACDRAFLKDDYGYVVDSNGEEEGLRIFRISDDTGISLLGFTATPGNAGDVFVTGNHAYIADGESGLAVVDISDPTKPVVASRVDTDGSAKGVFVSGDYAYIADGGNGVVIVDISTPAEPGVPTVLATGEDATGVFVNGSYAYIVTGDRVTIADISKPASPVVTGSTIETADTPHKVYIYNDYAYIADGLNGMVVVKLFEEGALEPSIASTYPADGAAIVDICGSGDYLYLARGEKGCTVVDVSDPAAPRKVKDAAATSSVSGVHISGDKVLLAEGHDGLTFIARYVKPDQTNGLGESDGLGECFIKSLLH